MGKRESKYIIGLTGNIGTGKSEVRKILQCLGALGIDADLISRQLMEPGGIAFEQVRDHFGNEFITPEGKLDRARLAALVFHDSERLSELESIIHPLVVNEVKQILNDTKIPVVVIEAIKLIESGLINQCDALWVTDTPEEIRLARLVLFREMSEEDARARITAQPSQEEKIKAANIVIQNTATLDDLLLEVKHAWETTVPDSFRRALQEVDCV